jgi:hypothetical protein
MQTVTSCFIRKVKLYLNILKSFHTDYHNKTKFKKRWIKSVRYILNIYRPIYILFAFQISKKYLCEHISQKIKVKIAKKANYKPYTFRVAHA